MKLTQNMKMVIKYATNFDISRLEFRMGYKGDNLIQVFVPALEEATKISKWCNHLADDTHVAKTDPDSYYGNQYVLTFIFYDKDTFELKEE